MLESSSLLRPALVDFLRRTSPETIDSEVDKLLEKGIEIIPYEEIFKSEFTDKKVNAQISPENDDIRAFLYVNLCL